MPPEEDGRLSGAGYDCQPLAARFIVASQVKEIWVREQMLQKQSQVKEAKQACTQKYSYQGLLMLIRNTIMLIRKTVTYMSTIRK